MAGASPSPQGRASRRQPTGVGTWRSANHHPPHAGVPRAAGPRRTPGYSHRRHAEEARHAPSRSTHNRPRCFETRSSRAPRHDEGGDGTRQPPPAATRTAAPIRRPIPPGCRTGRPPRDSSAPHRPRAPGRWRRPRPDTPARCGLSCGGGWAGKDREECRTQNATRGCTGRHTVIPLIFLRPVLCQEGIAVGEADRRQWRGMTSSHCTGSRGSSRRMVGI